ncbi:MAG: putative M18 family aminopeptidase 1 [Pelotomaculum sp. PtaU1.Bin035]|nr:MAG: putative M18 family aminopeptidase 1 [Pelotomaculum sp. PtaU1.Bin035]
MTVPKEQHPALKLAYRRRNVWDCLSGQEKGLVMAITDNYKSFLDMAKTEREAFETSLRYVKSAGFRPVDDAIALKPGDRVFAVNRHKALIAAVIGNKPLEYGLNVIGAHMDSPRLDLKPLPIYEEEGLVLFKTHYYGGIKKYQWLSIPLALHGIVIRDNGEPVYVLIGEKPGDPIFTITDLLPHLAKDQMDKKMADAVAGEGLNILVGGIPLAGEDLKDRFKLAILEHLSREYAIVEEDFISAELELVPAWQARDIGFDRSFIGGYGQDDRVCVYTALRALVETTAPELTALVVLADKEEIGSNGNTGMESVFFTNTIREIASRCVSGYKELTLRRIMSNSRALSADVNVGLDPGFKDVVETMNAARLGAGLVLTKYTGSKGKYESNDAHAEFVAHVRRVFNNAGVIWQTGELGKVDQGGGGTIAHLLAAHGMDVLDCGVALLGMHSPFEVASKADVYMAYKGYRAFYTR